MPDNNFSDATLMLIGHGSTRNKDSSAPVYQHAAELRRRRLFADVREAFIIQEPKIASVLAGLATSRVFVVPLFISEGYFTKEVIPRALGLGEVGPGTRSPVYCQPIGNDPGMTGILLARARDIVERFPFPRAPRPADITLFLAGHGTERDDGSRRAVERQVELIRDQNLYSAVHAVFIEEAPRIGDLYELARTRNIVVVPFFISDGQHTQEDIPLLLGESERVVRDRLKAGQAAWRNPTEKKGRLVWYSKAIGSEPHLADVILDRVTQALRSGGVD